MIRIVIEGEPIPKLTHRDRRYGKGKYSSQSRQKERWQEEVNARLALSGQAFEELLKGPISLSLAFVMQIPSSWPKKKIVELEQGKMFWHTFKPDASNMLKWLEDCLTGIIWEDDKQVALVHAMKYYGLKPLTEIFIQELTQ